MEKTKLLKRTILLLFLTFISVVICYYTIDKQVALWLAQHQYRSFKIFKYLSQLPEIFIVASTVICLFVVFRFCLDRWTRIDQRLLTFAYGIAITYLLKDFFKFIFGRYWPATWINNNPSLIKNQAYGFHFFHFGSNYGAFPSGHAAILFAGICLLWHLYPRFWLLYVLFALLSSIGILVMNYHFVGDIIGGSMLGYLIALFTIHFSKGKYQK